MAVVHQDDLSIIGALSAGNIAVGRTLITPVADTPTSVTVTGLDLQGTGDTYAITTPITAFPWARVRETSTTNEDETGGDVYIYRTNTVATYVHWMFIRDA